MYYASAFTDVHSVMFHFNSVFMKSMKPSSFPELSRTFPGFSSLPFCSSRGASLDFILHNRYSSCCSGLSCSFPDLTLWRFLRFWIYSLTILDLSSCRVADSSCKSNLSLFSLFLLCSKITASGLV